MSNFLSDILFSPLCAVFSDTLNAPLSLTELQRNDDLKSTSDTFQTPLGTMKALIYAIIAVFNLCSVMISPV